MYDDAVSVTLLETHISYVLLTGRYAYKLKKAVNLGFLDFTTLSARQFYCEEELRLNRRLAPDMYLDVVAITGSLDRPVLGGSGPILEYAVKMREFPQDALLDAVLARGALTAADIDALARRVAAFHAGNAVADERSAFGRPADILRLARQNFAQIQPLVRDASGRAELDALDGWAEREFSACADLMAGRRRDGFVRECHGDLHLGNIALVDGQITIFDCIEFNDEMRWIDVMNEVAFLVMDLQDRKRSDLAFRLLNAYLEATGDYAGVRVLPFYLAYRAMVRAKIAAFRSAQRGDEPADASQRNACREYLTLARSYAQPPHPAIIVTHGLAGSGKTTLSETLLEQIGAVRVRTDVERKRLHGVNVASRTDSPVGGGLYAPSATDATYRHVCRLARTIAQAGYVAVADGAFLKRWQRDRFRDAAAELGLPFLIVSCQAKAEALRERLARRYRTAADASEADAAVLDHQVRTAEPFASDELPSVLGVETDASPDDRWSARVSERVREALDRARQATGSGPVSPTQRSERLPPPR